MTPSILSLLLLSSDVMVSMLISNSLQSLCQGKEMPRTSNCELQLPNLFSQINNFNGSKILDDNLSINCISYHMPMLIHSLKLIIVGFTLPRVMGRLVLPGWKVKTTTRVRKSISISCSSKSYRKFQAFSSDMPFVRSMPSKFIALRT